ncbi:MAG: helix-turn-helix domain-containing protein [Thermoplasmata archaeon]
MGGGPPLPKLDPAQRETLERWARGRRVPYRLVIRSRIILRAASGLNNRAIARILGVSPLTVACWRSRFALLGVDGIARDAPRLGSRRTLSDATLRTILLKTVRERPADGKAWTSRSLARAVGVSHSTVLRVWRAHQVRRYQTPIAALAHDPRFEPRAIDVSGVYLSVPHGVVMISERLPRTSRSDRPGGEISKNEPTSGSRTARRSPGELVELLAQLEEFPPARSSAQRSRKEFLAFLGSVAGHRERGERNHLLLTRVDDSLRSVIEKWSAGGPEIRQVDSVEDTSLHEMVGRWLSERSKKPRTQIELNELPELRRAVTRWASDQSAGVRPFAWVNPGPN